MSTSTAPSGVPQWDLTDRLGKSLRVSGLSVHDMAIYFDVHRNTVSGWLHGRINPDTRTLRLWAWRTGVPYEWLRYGDQPSNDGDGGEQTPWTPTPLFLAPKPDGLSILRPGVMVSVKRVA